MTDARCSAPFQIAAPAAPRTARWERLAIVIITLVAAATRLPALDQFPPGASQDEVIRGYDAWCLWTSGADFHGAVLPAYLEAFGPGDYPAALSAYVMAPLIGWFGPSVALIRLPVAASAVATIVLLWWWVRREFGWVAGLAAAAVLTLSPWHVLVSRMGFEGLLTPFLVTLALVLVIRGRGVASPASMGAGGLALGAAMWNYSAPRLVLPILGLAWLVMTIRAPRDAAVHERSKRLWGWALLLAGGLIGAAPMIATLAATPERVLARAGSL